MNIDPLKPHPYLIKEKVLETNDSFTLTLKPLETRLLEPLPGQFNMLYAFGVGDVPISFSGPSSSNELIHTIKIVGNVTKALSRCEPGETIGVRGPYGKPWPFEEIKGLNLLLMAGGIGLAPLRSLIYYLLENRNDYGKIALLYGARNPEDLLFTKELKEWKEKLGGTLYTTVDVADENWKGNVGVVTTLLPKVPFSLEKTAALMCGPEIMMRLSSKDLLQKGIQQKNLYLSMERNMKCAIGHCGRCQLSPHFICKDGPVFTYKEMQPYIAIKEL